MAFTLDPDRIAFTITPLNHPITWYGILFACGFFLSYILGRQVIAKQFKMSTTAATALADKLVLFVALGGLIGARLFHVFFYEWAYYSQNLLKILKLWEGGLASHGGAVGVLIGLFTFRMIYKNRHPLMTFLTLLDLMTLFAPLVGGFIRVGNFINQEVLGTPTQLPWGVIFVHPVQNAPQGPLHPVQLYEAGAYFLIFLVLLALWKHRKRLGEALIAGWFFFLTFTFRFFIEFLKLPQSDLIDETRGINMGQILSLPFIILGLVLIFWRRKK